MINRKIKYEDVMRTNEARDAVCFGILKRYLRILKGFKAETKSVGKKYKN